MGRRSEDRDSGAVPSGAPEVLADLVDRLVSCPAFRGVPRAELAGLVREAEVAHLARPAPPRTAALVPLRGGVTVHDGPPEAPGPPLDLVGEGEYAAPAATQVVGPVGTALVLWLPDRARGLAWPAPATEAAVEAWADLAPARAVGGLGETPVRALMRSPVVEVHPDAGCREVAGLMRDERVSSVLVRATPADAPGIATDRDLRTRLVAEGRSPDTPVREIATWPARTVDGGATAFEALLEMLSSGTHHLPVAEAGVVVGMLSSGDLDRLESSSPLRVRVGVDRAADVKGVAEAVRALPEAVGALLAAGTAPGHVARMVSTVTDRVHARVLRLAAEELGPAPSAYGWLAFGSQARREQALHTDQDTGLLLPDDLTDAHLRAWEERAAWVTDALVRCGYRRCGGGVMASEPGWRATVSGWDTRVRRLVERPSEQHLMESTIVFDLRTVQGELDAPLLLGPALASAGRSPSFLGHLARQAVGHRPPIGFLGRFAVDRGGAHAGTFDVKAGALLPITDLARLAVMSAGRPEVATGERLLAAAEEGALSHDLADTLAAGHELALGLRLRRHVEQQRRGEPFDDRLDPASLSAPVRSQLRETFKAVRVAQEHLSRRYLTGLLG